MKTIGLIAGLVMMMTSIFSQNYIGMSQSKIQSLLGKPEVVTDNSISYSDDAEEGTNTYCFDEKKVCIAFTVTRNSEYLKSYQKLLKKDFIPATNSENEFTSKHDGFKAELKFATTDFSIRISKVLNADTNLASR